MVLKAVAFDWSGVVSGDRRPVYEANMRVLEGYNKSRLSFDGWLRASKGSASDLFISRGVQEPRGSDYLETLYKERLDEVGEDGIVPTMYADVLDVFRDIRERDVPITVISSHPEENLQREARRYGLSRFILSMISTRDKPEAIMRTCRELGLQPKELLYIGDTIFDIRSGKAAGVKTAGITTGYHSRKRLETENPDCIFDTLSEILDVLVPERLIV